jgi:glycerol uptake facilitator-like aquaporin
VTFGLVFGRKIGILKALLYIVFQCLGALIGAGLLKVRILGAVIFGKMTFGIMTLGKMTLGIMTS